MKTEKTYYLSSKITGLPEDEWREEFTYREEELIEKRNYLQQKDPSLLDIRIINPAKFEPEVENPQWQDYITEDIQILCDNADGIYLFGKWWSSCGAIMELLSAIRTNKEIVVENLLLKIPVKMLTAWFRKRM